MQEVLKRTSAKRVAVSPIVAGNAIKGPAAKMFRELGTLPSARAVAEKYRGLVDTFVIDKADQEQEPAIQGLGMQVHVTDTIMRTLSDRERVAREILNWVIRQPDG
jgi:LPPG:FO 2-phospho-L-lactate transferase